MVNTATHLHARVVPNVQPAEVHATLRVAVATTHGTQAGKAGCDGAGKATLGACKKEIQQKMRRQISIPDPSHPIKNVGLVASRASNCSYSPISLITSR